MDLIVSSWSLLKVIIFFVTIIMEDNKVKGLSVISDLGLDE